MVWHMMINDVVVIQLNNIVEIKINNDFAIYIYIYNVCVYVCV